MNNENSKKNATVDELLAPIVKPESNGSTITFVPLSNLHSFPNHPYQVRQDEALTELANSIKESGVLVPALVRPRAAGGYELISGHRRKAACAIAGVFEMPVIVRDMDDDTAVLAMVNSNSQRENLLPSEKALAYKMKLEALKRQAGRPKNNSDQIGLNYQGKQSSEILGEQIGESKNQVQRYIRLTYLTPKIRQMVDDKRIAFNPAVEISYLAGKEQEALLETMGSEECSPSLAQAQRMKKLSQDGKLDADAIFAIMTEEKANQVQKVSLKFSALQKFYPEGTTPQQIEADLIKLLEDRQRRRQRGKEQER